jgi:hypothetical protein
MNGLHHQTTLSGGKPFAQKVKNIKSCSPPIIRRFMVTMSPREIFRSLDVLFEPNQYMNPIIAEKNMNDKVYTVQYWFAHSKEN